MRSILAALAIGVLGVATAFAAGQDLQFRTATTVVPIYARVLGADGKPVMGLGRGDFAVLDNGKPTEVVSFSAEPVPMDIEVITEVSAANSMFLTTLDLDRTFLQNFKQFDALHQQSARPLLASLRPGDALSFMSTSDDHPRAGDETSMLISPRVHGPASLWPSLWDVLFRRLDDAQRGGRRRVMLLLVGESGKASQSRGSAGELFGESQVRPPSKHTQGEVIAKFVRESVTVSALTFDGWSVDQKHQVQSMVESSGGSFLQAHKTDDAGIALQRLSDEVHQAYTLGINAAVLDGKTHRLEVRLTGRADHVIARAGYLASEVPVDTPASARPATGAEGIRVRPLARRPFDLCSLTAGIAMPQSFLKAGEIVTLKIPLAAMSGTMSSFQAVATKGAINGRADWADMGLPSLLTMCVDLSTTITNSVSLWSNDAGISVALEGKNEDLSKTIWNYAIRGPRTSPEAVAYWNAHAPAILAVPRVTREQAVDMTASAAAASLGDRAGFQKRFEASAKDVDRLYGPEQMELLTADSLMTLLSIRVTGPVAYLEEAAAVAVEKAQPVPADLWRDVVAIVVKPTGIEAPDVTSVLVERGGVAVASLEGQLTPTTLATDRGLTRSVHAGRLLYPASAFAPGAPVRITLTSAKGERRQFDLGDAELVRIR